MFSFLRFTALNVRIVKIKISKDGNARRNTDDILQEVGEGKDLFLDKTSNVSNKSKTGQ